MPALRLYALVDGAQYSAQLGTPLTRQTGHYPLFVGTPDAALAHAGPWLVDVALADDALIEVLAALEQALPSVTWLIAPQSLDSLAQLLQLNLDIELPDGRAALLRFWDPRVLFNLAELLDSEQRESFFAHVEEWHLLHQGQRTWIGGPLAQAQ